MDTLDENGFRLLWPVLFLERSLPGHEQANLELERLILGCEDEHQSLTTDYLDENLFTLKNPAIEWLRRCVHQSTIDYCRRAGMDYSIDWSLQAWVSVTGWVTITTPITTPTPT